jgi:diacylglycerol kinase family enzyme
MDVIINASSGPGLDKSLSLKLSEMLSTNGFSANIFLARNGREVADFARRAARGANPLVVAGGGDGTINTVASALVGTDKILGVLPLGTFNHFAKDLNIPLDLEGAVRTIIDGHSIKIDVGEVNGRIFLNNSSLGLYPNIVNQREKHRRMGYSKWVAFFRATLTVLRWYPFLHVRLVADDHKIEGRTPFVFIGNNEYEIESLNLGSRACLNAGKLSLYMTHSIGRMELLKIVLRALFGRLRGASDFVALCTKEVWVEPRRKRVRVSTDGEVTIMKAPLYYRVRPGLLTVRVPKSPEVQ